MAKRIDLRQEQVSFHMCKEETQKRQNMTWGAFSSRSFDVERGYRNGHDDIEDAQKDVD